MTYRYCTCELNPGSTDRTMQDYNRDIWHLDPVEPKASDW